MPSYDPNQTLEVQVEELDSEEVAHVAPLMAVAIPGEAAQRIGRIGAGVAQSLIRSSALFNSEPGSVFASGSDQQGELMINLGM